MPNMKIRVDDTNRQSVKQALLDSGYELAGSSNWYDKAVFFTTYEGDTEFYHSPFMDSFDLHENTEYILTPQGTLMPAAEYYRYPETEYAKRFPCEGCRPGDCIGCGDNAPAEKTLEEKTPANTVLSDDIEKAFLEKHLPPGNYIAPLFTTEKTYVPLPIQPTSQWLSDRMSLLAEHISYSLANNLSVDNKLTRELHVLSHLLRDSEEGE